MLEESRSRWLLRVTLICLVILVTVMVFFDSDTWRFRTSPFWDRGSKVTPTDAQLRETDLLDEDSQEIDYHLRLGCCGTDWACTFVEAIAKEFPKDFKVTFVQDPPTGGADVIIRSAWGKCSRPNPQENSQLSQVFQKVLVQMEPRQKTQSDSDGIYLATTHFLNPTNISFEKRRGIYLPYMVMMNYGHFRREHLIRDPNEFDAKAVLDSKTEFASFLARYCMWGTSASPENIPPPLDSGPRAGELRLLATRALQEQYKAVSYLGGCGKNYRVSESPPKDYTHERDEAVFWHSRFKFAFAMENSRVDGYITEKLANARLANAIPIYLGDPGVEEMVNPRAIVHCEPQGKWPQISWTTCIDEIKRLDQNDTAYMEKLAEPLFHGGEKLPPWMKLDTYAARLAKFWREDLERAAVAS